MSWLLPGRGGHRAPRSTGDLSPTAWLSEHPARRRLVRVRRVPPELLPLCGRDGHYLVGPHVRPGLHPSEWARPPMDQEARRRELEEAVRRLNTWSSGGGGRR
ncbi:hypothetical protein ACWIG5_26965 [Streptomyces lydicus]